MIKLHWLLTCHSNTENIGNWWPARRGVTNGSFGSILHISSIESNEDDSIEEMEKYKTILRVMKKMDLALPRKHSESIGHEDPIRHYFETIYRLQTSPEGRPNIGDCGSASLDLLYQMALLRCGGPQVTYQKVWNVIWSNTADTKNTQCVGTTPRQSLPSVDKCDQICVLTKRLHCVRKTLN